MLNQPLWLSKVPPGYWKKKSSRILYMEWLGQLMGFNSPEDWYAVTRDSFVRNHGASLVSQFKNFPFDIVREFHPKFEYKKWLFHGSVGNNYWDEMPNVVSYMDWLKAQLEVETHEDWYNKLSASSIRKHKGWGLLKKYGMSPVKLLRACYPEYDWKPYLFKNAPLNSWSDKQIRFDYMSWLEKRLEIHNPEDWYQVSGSIIKKHKGRTLLRYMNNVEIIREYRSDCHFYEWMFAETPKQFWHVPYNRRRYLYWLGEVLGFKHPEDWYCISVKHFRENHGRALLSFHNESPAEIVVKNIEWNWDIEQFSYGLKEQKHLYRTVRSIFQGRDVFWNYWHPELVFEASGSKMQLDIFIPSVNIAFEYQGRQHYEAVPKFGGADALKDVKRRDKEKKQACSDAGIALVEVPYTWNRTRESVVDLLCDADLESRLPETVFKRPALNRNSSRKAVK